NVSNPSSPYEVGRYVEPNFGFHGVHIDGNYAYLANSGGGLKVVDVSIPSSPVEIGYYDTPGIALNVNVSGNYVYVADDHCGLQIYEFTLTDLEDIFSQRADLVLLVNVVKECKWEKSQKLQD
ncbi:MAG: hypothetical protein ABIM32_02785, partial [candidate division WOR-3 bacterium]